MVKLPLSLFFYVKRAASRTNINLYEAQDEEISISQNFHNDGKALPLFEKKGCFSATTCMYVHNFDETVCEWAAIPASGPRSITSHV